MKHTLSTLAVLSLLLIASNAIPAGMAQKRAPRARTNAARRPGPHAAAALFGGVQSYPAGFGVSQSVAADFNGDGIADLAVVNACNSSDCGSGYASVAILIANGDGTFQPPVMYATNSYQPMSLAVGDFNGDGAADLVVASQCASSASCGTAQVSVLLGNGDGTFQPAVAYPAGSGASYFVVAGDFNGDGNLDLAVADQTSANSAVAILLGNGDGTFQAPVSFSTGATSAAFLAVGDFNEDGAADLAVANAGTGDSVSILLGNGDGTFQTAVLYASGGILASSVAVGDFNADGAPDLVVVNGCATYTNLSSLTCSPSGSVAVLLGNGDGTFQPAATYGSGGSEADFVTVADFNGDGNLDLAVSNQGPSAGGDGNGVVSLLLGNGDGTFQPAAAYGTGGSLAVSVSAGDFNGDGQPDLAVVNQCPTAGSCTNSLVGALLNTASNFSLYANSISLSSAINPAGSGQAVLLTATVTPKFSAGAPIGNVTFYDGGNALSTVAVSNGQASYTASFTAPGPHALEAVYAGDTNYAASSSAILRETVGTPVMLQSSVNPSALSQAVTFTAMVAGTGVAPTGSVTFLDGVTPLGTLPLVNGSAAITQSALAAGGHSITASYSGDANYAPGSATLAQAVSQTSTTVLSSSVNPIGANLPISFTATVTGQNGGVPDGAVAFMQGTPPTTFGTAPLVNGQATISNSFNQAGSYPVVAVYLGGPDYQTSTSAVVNQVVNASASVTTSTALASSGSPSAVSQPVTFTATVTATQGGIPDGEIVTFYNGTVTLGAAATANGVAVLSTSSLPAGNNSITATYPGDGTYLASTSRAVNQVVTLNPTATTLASSLNPSTYGQSVTFTVGVAPQSGPGTPTGTVLLKNGALAIASITLSNGGGSFTTASLSAGSLSITASYVGDASFASSSASLTQVVSQATTTTALTSTPNPSSLNQTVAFTATVTGQYGAKTAGTVTFTQGDGTLGSAATIMGKATVTATFSATGTYPVVATYAGDANDAGSASPALNQVVNKISTTTVVTSSGSPATVGQTVTFTATVTPSSGAIPDGETVTFYDGAAAIGTGATRSGAATLATSALAVGSHSITATYAGDASFQTSTSRILSQAITLNSSVTTLASSANPSAWGQSVTFTANVAAGSGSAVPTGKVLFKNGAASLAYVSLVNGSAGFTISSLAAGSVALTAAYSGDANFAASSGTLTQVVNQSVTTTTLTSTPNPSVAGQTVTVIATITGQYAGTTSGSVSFMNGSKSLGSVPVASGKAALTTAFSTVGTNSITAVYGGDVNNQASTSAVLSQVVTVDPTTTTITSSGSPAYAGQPVAFTATVTSSYGAIPDGEPVAFYDSGTVIGTGNTQAGTATMTTSTLSAGVHSVTAVYPGDPSFQNSTSKVFKQTINLNSTTTLLSTSANPNAYGQPITFTATVTSGTPGGPTPAGTVTFKNGAVALAVATLNAQGSASMTTLTLGAGIYSITAAYNGDKLSAKSTSAALNQAVSQAATTTQLISSVNPAAAGESVTFTAIVKSATAFATGSVTFNAGSTVLGTATIYNGSAALAVTTLPTGATDVTATYTGTANVAGSFGSIVQYVQ